MRHINLELVRVTEAAAIAASAWIGSGQKEPADKAATDAMKERLDRMDFSGKIVIGEGKKDKSYGLFCGDKVGALSGLPRYDLAVDPIEGTRPTVTSGPEATSVLAVAKQDSLFQTESFYMQKLAYGPEIASKTKLDLKDPLSKIIEKVSKATGKDKAKIMVCLLDRPRHQNFIAELRKLNVRIKLIQDCDVSGAIATCLPRSGIDLLYGVGGAPEAVITACAIKCLRGDFQAQLAGDKGEVIGGKVYFIQDMVRGECAFAATGITDGSLLRGVRYESSMTVTHSVFMRSESGTVRWLTTLHGN